jgi:Aerotolerance regulator N-terminal/von Willebrand factor type A domain
VTFLAPLFLAGLAAVAIPVIVHLTNRPRREAYAFPSLMFLARIPFRSVKHQRVRHWWLLALRIGVVALIVSAFARPLLSRLGAGGGAFATGSEVVVLLDDSYSMRYGDRWQQAVAAAEHVVDGLGPNDRATVVLFDARARALGQASADRAALHAELAAARPGFGTTRYAAGLELARDVLQRSTLPRREVVLISDFQQAGVQAEASLRLPDGTVVRPVDVAPGPAAGNVAVVGALVERSEQGGRDQATVTARVAVHGREPARALAVELVADGRTVETRRAEVAAGADRVVTFRPLPVARAPVRVTVRTAGDRLPPDDAYHLVVAPGDVLHLTLVGTGPGEYLRRALSVSADPRFAVTGTTALRAADMAAGRVLIVDDPAPLAPALAARATAFVRAGGGLLVILGPRGAAESWSPAWSALLGGMPGVPQQPEGASGVGLVALAFDHPIFEVFRAPGSGDLASTRVYRYRRFRVDPAGGATALAQYDDGAPALVEHRLGAGKVLVWTSPFDNVWSDLPVQPVFLPLVHQMVRYLASFARRPGALTVGALLDVGQVREALGAGSALVLETPDGRHVPLDSAGAGVSLDAPGFYRARRMDGRPPAQDVAVNVDPVEGDLTPLDVKAFVAAVEPRNRMMDAGEGGGGQGQAALSAAERERRQGVWWYLVVGAVVVALAESLLSNRLPALRRPGSSSQGAA